MILLLSKYLVPILEEFSIFQVIQIESVTNAEIPRPRADPKTFCQIVTRTGFHCHFLINTAGLQKVLDSCQLYDLAGNLLLKAIDPFLRA